MAVVVCGGVTLFSGSTTVVWCLTHLWWCVAFPSLVVSPSSSSVFSSLFVNSSHRCMLFMRSFWWVGFRFWGLPHPRSQLGGGSVVVFVWEVVVGWWCLLVPSICVCSCWMQELDSIRLFPDVAWKGYVHRQSVLMGSCSLYLRDCSYCSCFSDCWGFVVAGSLVVLMGGWSPLSRYLLVDVVVIFPSFWSSKLLCAFPTSPSSSAFGRRRPLGLERVVQLWWIQFLEDWRFFSSVKKDGTMV